MSKNNDFKKKRLLDTLEQIDDKFIYEAAAKIKPRPTVAAAAVPGKSLKRSIKQGLLLVACLLLISGVIPVITLLIQNTPQLGGPPEESTQSYPDYTTSPEPDVTTVVEDQTTVPGTTFEDCTTQDPNTTLPEETSSPDTVYEPDTTVPEETTTPEETTAEETTAVQTTTEETTQAPEPETTVPEETTTPPEPEYDGSRGLEYKISLDGKSAILTGIGSCTDKNVTVASKYNGVPVTAIGDSAFFSCTSIKSVIIPESVTSIGAHAFSLCSSLESISLPDKVTSIETYAFHACTSLKTADLGEGVKKIGDYAFDKCENLESINFGNSLQSIGNQAFMQCTSIKELTFPNTLTSIGDWVFDCPKVERVILGKNIKTIGEAAFVMCGNLSEFVFRGTRENWKSVTLGKDWKSRQFSIIKCSDGDIDLNAPLEYNGSQGLVYQLSKDKKSASLVKIGTCTDKNIVIASTFGGVPVVAVAEGVFKDNQNITGIYIPATVTTLNGLFYNCQNIVSLTVDPDHPSFYSAGNCIIDKQSKTLIVGCNGSVIPDDGSILRIGMSSFDGCNGITELTIPDGVLIIYDYAFDNCINLRSVKIPDSVTKINSAFNGCTSLENVELPSEMVWLGGFSDCISLKKITLPKKAELSSGSFIGCTSLESITVPSGTTSLYSTFEGCTRLKNIILPDTLTSISKSAFLNCTSLESIAIPGSVTELNTIG